jgi:iron(III) transport system substrate-binding protein
MADSNIRARVAIEHRAGQRSWDLVATSPVYRLGNEILAPFDPPQAKELIPQARDPNRRWYGYSGNYNTPAYNTTKVKPEELPKSYEEFIERKQWTGMVATLKPVVIDGHLNLARQVGAGEYVVALNNYVPLTINLKLAGVPTDFWALDPVSLTFGSIGVYAQAPHPKSALLAANYMLSHEGQSFLTRKGRLPSRPDVATNPPGVLELLGSKTIVTTMTSVNEQRRMQQAFNDIFRPR